MCFAHEVDCFLEVVAATAQGLQVSMAPTTGRSRYVSLNTPAIALTTSFSVPASVSSRAGVALVRGRIDCPAAVQAGGAFGLHPSQQHLTAFRVLCRLVALRRRPSHGGPDRVATNRELNDGAVILKSPQADERWCRCGRQRQLGA
jgi:hypothetical protein